MLSINDVSRLFKIYLCYLVGVLMGSVLGYIDRIVHVLIIGIGLFIYILIKEDNN